MKIVRWPHKDQEGRKLNAKWKFVEAKMTHTTWVAWCTRVGNFTPIIRGSCSISHVLKVLCVWVSVTVIPMNPQKNPNATTWLELQLGILSVTVRKESQLMEPGSMLMIQWIIRRFHLVSRFFMLLVNNHSNVRVANAQVNKRPSPITRTSQRTWLSWVDKTLGKNIFEEWP